MKKTLKSIATFLICASLLVAMSFAAIANTNTYLGDANHDGIVNSTDALLMLKHSVGSGSIAAQYISDADMNGDAIINSTDALIALKTSVGSKSLELAPTDRILYYYTDGTTGYTPKDGAEYCYQGCWSTYTERSDHVDDQTSQDILDRFS